MKNNLPTKAEIRKLFPDYVVSITAREMNVAVAQLTLKLVPALIVTCIAHRTERYASFHTARYSNHPVEMDPLSEGLKILKDAGYNAFCSNFGLTIIPSDVIRAKF